MKRIAANLRTTIMAGTAFVLAFTGGAHAFTLVLYDPSFYDSDTATMDAALGLTGQTIEGFEDTALASGLSVQFDNPALGPVTTLAALYQPSSGQPQLFPDAVWDGSGALINHTGNYWPADSGVDPLSETLTLLFADPQQSVGIGLSHLQTSNSDHTLIINGISALSIDTLPGFASGTARNLYMQISAESGESISSVSIGTDGQNADALIVDHVAFSGSTPVPAPQGLPLMLTAVAILAIGRRRTR